MQEEVEAGRAKEYFELLNHQETDSPFWTQLKLQQGRGAEPRLQAGLAAGQSPQPSSTTAPRCLTAIQISTQWESGAALTQVVW